MQVLIADDSALIRERLVDMLKDIPGVAVGQVTDASTAIKSARTLKPDVLILDIHMPGGNGFQVLEDIKKDNSAPIVMMLSNYPYPQYRERCQELGADFFFDKSTDFDKLLGVLKELNHQAAR